MISLQVGLVLIGLLLACAFEFINGFHDTANAVATVIYTRSLPPKVAVVLSGICNFLGVFVGGIVVAVGIVNLLPIELITNSNQELCMIMVLSLLTAAIAWNLGTWYLGIPSSSSHTLIGSILGVGIAYSLVTHQSFTATVNWGKATEIGLSLLISPLVGFGLAALFLVLMKKIITNKNLYEPKPLTEKPPFWVRAILTLTCSGVSFAHGSNDGQKGIGLIMLILIAAFPMKFALNPNITNEQIQNALVATSKIESVIRHESREPDMVGLKDQLSLIRKANAEDSSLAIQSPMTQQLLQHVSILKESLSVKELDPVKLRAEIFQVDKQVNSLLKKGYFSNQGELKTQVATLRTLTDFAPTWVFLCVALALGLGTMVGWKRIVVTVGTKIGEQHMSYSQGMTAEVVAMSTIGLASVAGLPVSTTHVLSSGVAGTMVAEGVSLQKDTVKKILLAWFLTLPVSILLSGGLFLLLRYLFVS